jgi:hypothetical protein
VALLQCIFFVRILTSWFGVLFMRPLLRLFVRRQPGLNDAVGYFLSFFGVVYGLLLGMLAIVTYQALSEAEKNVVQESSSLAALYRDVSSYPEPSRSQMQSLLREYTRYVIEEAWPLQRQGIIPKWGTIRFTEFQLKLMAFEPQTMGQQALHAETLREFNATVIARRMRLYSVQSGVPPIMWYTIVASSGICLIMMWMLDLRVVAQLFLGGLGSVIMALMISLIVLMDHPFRGEVSVSPESFQLVYDDLMKSEFRESTERPPSWRSSRSTTWKARNMSMRTWKMNRSGSNPVRSPT